MIPYLPAEATVAGKDSEALRKRGSLLFQVVFKNDPLLVFLANIVRGRGDNEPGMAIRNLA